MPRMSDELTPTQRVLSNGAVYDHSTGRIVRNPGGGKYAITSETAHDMHKARLAKKRAIVQAAALEAVQNTGLIGNYGDAAWIAEISQAQMAMATTPDAGKAAVMAAEWLIKHAGLDEPKRNESDVPVTQTNIVNVLIAEYIADPLRAVIDED